MTTLALFLREVIETFIELPDAEPDPDWLWEATQPSPLLVAEIGERMKRG